MNTVDLNRLLKNRNYYWIFDRQSALLRLIIMKQGVAIKMRMKFTLIIVMFLSFCGASIAQEDELLEPDIVITSQKQTLVEEYRIAGQTYMIKITPKKGRHYFLVDNNGDGSLESRMNNISPNYLIPSWVLLHWK
jgi:hypothetical protein